LDFNRRTPIHATTARGNFRVLNTLLACPGAKELVNVKDNGGQTALGLLRKGRVSGRKAEAENLLLGFGADH
jgi:hypothetical protein